MDKMFIVNSETNFSTITSFLKEIPMKQVKFFERIKGSIK